MSLSNPDSYPMHSRTRTALLPKLLSGELSVA
jgi:hypothetical protein